LLLYVSITQHFSLAPHSLPVAIETSPSWKNISSLRLMHKTIPLHHLPLPPPPPPPPPLPPPPLLFLPPFHTLIESQKKKRILLLIQKDRENLKNCKVAMRVIKSERLPEMRIMGSIQHTEEYEWEAGASGCVRSESQGRSQEYGLEHTLQPKWLLEPMM